MTDETVVIDTPEGMSHFAMCQVIGRLRIETETGLKFRSSTLKAAQKAYGVRSRTKAGALQEMLDLYVYTYGKEYANGRYRASSPDAIEEG